MSFNSLTFIAFLGVVVALHRLPISWRARKRNLLIASYAFYAAWNPPFVVLIWVSTIADWLVARRMHTCSDDRGRKGLLLLSILVNLGLLGYFKYGGFLLENFVALARGLGVGFTPPALDIVLPVGISFYTFQTMSYSLDVYRRKLEPCPSFLDFALFVTFFPQLVAGPIVRARTLLPQFLEEKRARAGQMGWGLVLLSAGLFEKVVLADGLMAPIVNAVYSDLERAGSLDLWVASMSFAAQIFFDFSGYSLCGIGVAMCLGFALPDNFRFPFACVGFADFWRRWHITLSSWMREYLYVPLGRALRFRGRAAVAGVVTMAAVGLWHGAAWGFVMWGFVNGLCLVGERQFQRATGDRPWKKSWAARRLGNVVTMGLLVLFLPLFRLPSGDGALEVIGSMLIGAPSALELGSLDATLGLGTLPLLMAGHTWLRDSSLESAWQRVPAWVRPALVAVLLIGIAIAPRHDSAFIYFQF